MGLESCNSLQDPPPQLMHQLLNSQQLRSNSQLSLYKYRPSLSQLPMLLPQFKHQHLPQLPLQLPIQLLLKPQSLHLDQQHKHLSSNLQQLQHRSQLRQHHKPELSQHLLQDQEELVDIQCQNLVHQVVHSHKDTEVTMDNL